MAAEPTSFGPEMEPFKRGLAALKRNGKTVGHVATSLGHFRTPFAPRTPQPWVWLVVVWDDGVKEPSVEDYPPWTYVAEMRAGYLDWQHGRGDGRRGRYEIEWVAADLAAAERERLGIRTEDF
ncbi:MAG: hypothetical protein KQH57_12410 [Actinomycetales bacterium]|nr:hypothetical protein [Actinomycetales bacterium]